MFGLKHVILNFAYCKPNASYMLGIIHYPMATGQGVTRVVVQAAKDSGWAAKWKMTYQIKHTVTVRTTH